MSEIDSDRVDRRTCLKAAAPLLLATVAGTEVGAMGQVTGRTGEDFRSRLLSALAGLIAPRRLHLSFGEKDGGSPIDEVRRAIPVISAAYAAAGAKERFTWFIEEGAGHLLSEAM